ncbi:hypothetical protein NDU88_006566 [Pleurodeles waltl]|uniref:Uncharacterized protein n=1 Tax=Pleurodeles waltl TaxID=8319 RepID=A0AAV7N3V0_PLEWA|nr:hypothetical protein NDU88_006566 [Pleurodeles waltl]
MGSSANVTIASTHSPPPASEQSGLAVQQFPPWNRSESRSVAAAALPSLPGSLVPRPGLSPHVRLLCSSSPPGWGPGAQHTAVSEYGQRCAIRHATGPRSVGPSYSAAPASDSSRI